MRRYSPHRSPPRRGYGGRGRSPPRGRYGGRKDGNTGSLLVRNIPMDCRPEELRISFERYGPIRDVYLPKDYYTGNCCKARVFDFVTSTYAYQCFTFVDPFDASEAQYHMNGQIFFGREITVVVAAETRKRPEEMRTRGRVRGNSGYDSRRSSYYAHSRSRSISRSRSPVHHSRARYRSRSYSPAPRRSEYSPSPSRRHAERSRSPVVDREHGSRRGRRSLSPVHDRRNHSPDGNGYEERPSNDGARRDRDWESPKGTSRSPPGSRSRSADLSPRPGRH